jgi:hypothetical protein
MNDQSFIPTNDENDYGRETEGSETINSITEWFQTFITFDQDLVN